MATFSTVIHYGGRGNDVIATTFNDDLVKRIVTYDEAIIIDGLSIDHESFISVTGKLEEVILSAEALHNKACEEIANKPVAEYPAPDPLAAE